jgi:hypothetical protein
MLHIHCWNTFAGETQFRSPRRAVCERRRRPASARWLRGQSGRRIDASHHIESVSGASVDPRKDFKVSKVAWLILQELHAERAVRPQYKYWPRLKHMPTVCRHRMVPVFISLSWRPGLGLAFSKPRNVCRGHEGGARACRVPVSCTQLVSIVFVLIGSALSLSIG